MSEVYYFAAELRFDQPVSNYFVQRQISLSEVSRSPPFPTSQSTSRTGLDMLEHKPNMNTIITASKYAPRPMDDPRFIDKRTNWEYRHSTSESLHAGGFERRCTDTDYRFSDAECTGAELEPKRMERDSRVKSSDSGFGSADLESGQATLQLAEDQFNVFEMNKHVQVGTSSSMAAADQGRYSKVLSICDDDSKHMMMMVKIISYFNKYSI